MDVNEALEHVARRTHLDVLVTSTETERVLADAIHRVQGMCEVWIEREPNCAGVLFIRDELRHG